MSSSAGDAPDELHTIAQEVLEVPRNARPDVLDITLTVDAQKADGFDANTVRAVAGTQKPSAWPTAGSKTSDERHSCTRAHRVEDPHPTLRSRPQSVAHPHPVTAVADLVDNSIDAGAAHVVVRFLMKGARPVGLQVIGDGRGMDSEGIGDATLTYGKKRNYKQDDLGHFGIGLKAASLSQAKTMTVWSGAHGSRPSEGVCARTPSTKVPGSRSSRPRTRRSK